MLVRLYHVADSTTECSFLVEAFYSRKKNMSKRFSTCLLKLRKVWKESDYRLAMNFREELQKRPVLLCGSNITTKIVNECGGNEGGVTKDEVTRVL